LNADTNRYTSVSGKIQTDDLDWQAGRDAGITSDEKFVLTYFSDIECQTIRYLSDLLRMKIAFQPPVIAFLTTWNYEEFFHGQALNRLLAECGYPMEVDRVERVSQKAHISEWFEWAFGRVLARIFSDEFPALYMAYGAIQELTTLRGYERLALATRNPILKTLCERIARQERRHFAWYFNCAKENLAKSGTARFITRKLLELTWAPVGASVKSREDIKRLFSILFPGESGRRVVVDIDSKIGALPGLSGISLMGSYFSQESSFVASHEVLGAQAVSCAALGSAETSSS
jgi:hypothetical protein